MTSPVIDQVERWYQMEGDEAAHQVITIVESLWNDVGSAHRDRWFRARSMYESRIVSDERMSLNGELGSQALYNMVRSAVDTAQAEIAARQRPKPMFLTTGADWRTRRKAKKLDRFVEAWMSRKQSSRYSDLWELTEDAFKDASLAVGGVVKVVVDLQGKAIRYERIPAYEILVDPSEAARGDPQNWFHRYDMDLDIALRIFTPENATDEERQAIKDKLEGSVQTVLMDMSKSKAWRATRTVSITEAWRLPFSSDEPGKHLFACRNGLLGEITDWTWPRPPFAILSWTKEPFGVWGIGLGETGAYQHEMINDLSRRIHDRFVLNASRRTYYKPGVVDDAQLKSNDAEVLIPVDDMSQVPQSVDIPPITDAESQFLTMEIQRFYDIQGISQMSASQRKEPGVDAAVAMQTLNDIKSVRFMTKARAYELLFVALGELTVLAARDLAEEHPNFSATWADKKFLASIDWKDVELKDEFYEARVAPVSALSRDPAQRLQLVEQLSNMGYLPKEKYFELLQMPDLDGVFDQQNGESEWIEMLVERYLDAEDDADLKKRGGFVYPDGYLLNPIAALATVAQQYFGAMRDGAPDFNCELLREFMSALQDLINPPQQPPMETPNLAPGVAPPAGAPGAPPAGAPSPGPMPSPAAMAA